MVQFHSYISDFLKVVCITDQTHISYFSIFLGFFVQNKKSLSRIKEKMQINVDKYKIIQKIKKSF